MAARLTCNSLPGSGGSRPTRFSSGRGFVIPEDVKSVGFDVLRHRMILTYEAEAEEVTR